MKKNVALLLIKILDPLILWCFGWKQTNRIYYKNHIPVLERSMWYDPEKKYGWQSKQSALSIINKRITRQ